MADDTSKEKREFGVVLESIDSNVKHIVEAVDTHTQQLERLDKRVGTLEGKVDKVDDRLASIEVTLEAVNLPALKQKIIALEKRLTLVEAKVNT